MQILLSELLGVPTTIETGKADMSADFYDQGMALDYGVSYPFECLENAANVNDCREIPFAEGEDYQPCCQVMPEVWMGM